MSVALTWLRDYPAQEQRLVARNNREKWRTETMAVDDRDILEILKQELSFIEEGGYGRQRMMRRLAGTR